MKPARKSINYLAKGGKTERGSIRGEVRGGEEWAGSLGDGGEEGGGDGEVLKQENVCDV